jgi:predicted phage terminase large subunit-like protein
MNSALPKLRASRRDTFRPTLVAREQTPRQVLLNPTDFAAYCFTDPAGRVLQQSRLHHDLQRFLSAHGRALVELPRDHGKSVQICIRILWELGHDPSLRVKIVCASDELAAERCRFLHDHIASNRRLRQVFPNLRPALPWGVTRFTIARPAHVIGPSVTAVGVGSASTGSRADLLVCDDIVDVKSIHSRADRERVKTFFHENLMNQLEPDGRFWGLFTPWHVDDLNAVLKRNSAYALFRRAVGDDLEPVWPEKWPRERLAARKQEIGSLSFARAYRLVCIPEEEVPIRPGWIRFWNEPRMNADERGYEQIVLSVDPAVSCKPDADRSALVTLGRTANNEIHCLEAIARRVAAPELLQLIDDADRRWQPDAILFESNAAFAGLRDLLMRQARFGPKIKSITQTRDKASRVHAFSIPVENGTFRLRGDGPNHVDPGQQGLWDEMTSFPLGEHDDLLDAAAGGVAYLLDKPEPRIW